MMLINPYIAGNPARAGGFFGRQDILDWVSDELRSPHVNVLVIFGQRRIGKTSLLLKLEITLPSDTYFPVYFDLQDKAREPLPRLLQRLAGAIARKVHISPPEQAAFEENGADYFRAVFLPQVHEKLGKGIRIVFLFDEFEVVDKTFHPFLRELMGRDPTLGFVFATGRKTEDLNQDTQTTFKASLQKQVWVLDPPSAEALIRQGEDQGNLVFTDEAIRKILRLTSGHPYLTQLLCHHIWALSERRHRSEPLPPDMADRREHKKPREIYPRDVREALPEALESGDHVLVWIWDGLTPAEKIFTAAMGGLASVRGIVSIRGVMETLAKVAPKRRIHDVKGVVRDLVKRRVLKEAGGEMLSFEVVLFQQWVMERKPLREVENELNRMKPEAEKLYGLANQFFQKGKWNLAIRSLKQVLEEDSRHVQAHLDLGECFLHVENNQEAVAALEDAHRLSPRSARLPLVRALIIRAREILQINAREALGVCDQIRHLSPREPEIAALEKEAWRKQGDAFLEAQDRRQALNFYKKSGDLQKAKEIEQYKKRCRQALGEIIEGIESATSLAHTVSTACNEPVRDKTVLNETVRHETEELLLLIAHLYKAEEDSLHLLRGALGYLGREKADMVRKKFEDIRSIAPRQDRLSEFGPEYGLSPTTRSAAPRVAADFISAVEWISIACKAAEAEFDDPMYLEGWRLTRNFLRERIRMAHHYLLALVTIDEGETQKARRWLEPFMEDFVGVRLL